jgi:hypothetical protein
VRFAAPGVPLVPGGSAAARRGAVLPPRRQSSLETLNRYMYVNFWKKGLRPAVPRTQYPQGAPYGHRLGILLGQALGPIYSA